MPDQMDPPPLPHKRTKSGMARSLLSRVGSKQDIHTELDTSISPVARTDSSPLSAAAAAPSYGAPPVARPSAQMPSPAQSAPASIEQSVKLFRAYEALRNGDTAAISKLVREAPLEGGSRPSTTSLSGASSGLEGTSMLHLAVQCADQPVIEYILSASRIDVNARDRDGNTPLHIAAQLSRAPIVNILLAQKGINDTLTNYQGRTALDLAKNPDVFQQLQLARSVYIDAKVKDLQLLVANGEYDTLEQELLDSHLQSAIDVNGGELATEPATIESGGTLLHEAARKKDARLIQILLLNGADPFRRDRKGKLPQDVTKDDKIQKLLKKSPEAAAAQRGIQERTILGSGVRPDAAAATGENALGGKEGREMKGYLKKWTNYTSGYKLRWFVLEDGVLSYYKHQDDAGSACRGAINMRIARLHMDAQDKLRFEIHGKSSVKYHLKANHQVEAKRWFWALNNAIQFGKDEAKEEKKRIEGSKEAFRQAKASHTDGKSTQGDSTSLAPSKSGSRLIPVPAGTLDRFSSEIDGNETGTSFGEPSVAGDELRHARTGETTAIEGDLEDDELPDDASSVEMAQPATRDAFMITAHSARLQLDLLSQISAALQAEKSKTPDISISDPRVAQALTSYESSVANLKGLIGDLGRIARDRESFWHHRLEQEVNVRRIWEENMAHVAREQEELENRIGESEEKRRRTKRALRDALEGQQGVRRDSLHDSSDIPSRTKSPDLPTVALTRPATGTSGRRQTLAEIEAFAESDSEDEAEFFDALDAGQVAVVAKLPVVATATKTVAATPVLQSEQQIIAIKEKDIKTSWKGYEDPVRERLKMDADNRPKISLWGILKSMIGKDMTKMTLPVSFNEPTSLLQRVAEDMEYTDLLDMAATRPDSTERMVYVAAFAASEYASTVGRVAKPFNPLLGETYEYVRPDKGYRFFVEQVSHHPPIGAAYAEAPTWEYWGESAVQSKFYGRSFDINPLGTWFLKLRPTASPGAPEELYTWKKVTSSVVGIITGSPTVDNYGPMQVTNHTTGETCVLDFKQRGWKASSAYQVTGKVLAANGSTCWSMGGRWNDKIYARLTPGFEVDPSAESSLAASKGAAAGVTKAILVWQAHTRPTGIPFNLTPFVLTLNALPERLQAHLPPTDTRLRPDQRAMEDGEYDFAATEKNRVENKQRAARREREQRGEEWAPKWFTTAVDKTTGEKYWAVKRTGGANAAEARPEYWACRDAGDFSRSDDIF